VNCLSSANNLPHLHQNHSADLFLGSPPFFPHRISLPDLCTGVSGPFTLTTLPFFCLLPSPAFQMCPHVSDDHHEGSFHLTTSPPALASCFPGSGYLTPLNCHSHHLNLSPPFLSLTPPSKHNPRLSFVIRVQTDLSPVLHKKAGIMLVDFPQILSQPTFSPLPQPTVPPCPPRL